MTTMTSTLPSPSPLAAPLISNRQKKSSSASRAAAKRDQPEMDPSSPRSSTEELQESKQLQEQTMAKKNGFGLMLGSNDNSRNYRTTTNCAKNRSQNEKPNRQPTAPIATVTLPSAPRRPMFSSVQEEPITMSATALASVIQDVHFAEADDVVMPMEVKVHSLHVQQSTSSMWSDLLRGIGACDISYSTSSLTRHTQAHGLFSPLPDILGLILQDFLGRLTLQSPLRSPFVLHRIITLIWNGGPNYRYQSNHNNAYTILHHSHPKLANYASSASRSSLPPSVKGIPNYGQTCFLNAILQSLASLDSVLAYAEWIAREQQQQQEQLQQEYLKTSNKNNNKKKRRRHDKPIPTTTVSELLSPLLQALNGQARDQSNQKLDPRDLLWRIAQKNPQFQSSRHLFGSWASSATGEQQDAQELLQALLEMMIVDAHLEETPCTTTPSATKQGFASDIASVFREEKKDDDDDDEVLTVLSDRWSSPRNSSNNSLCSSVEEEPKGEDNASTAILNQVQMVDANGVMASYENQDKQQQQKPYFNGLSSSILSAPSSLESSFLSTTSTVVTSPAREHRQHQQPQAMSGSMQIMLSTISSITKTPLSCWTGSLVQCQACHHNRAVRNQEWRDIPIVPTALSTDPSKIMGSAPPCTLQECLRNFCQVERVPDVECGNCTLQRDIQHWQEEVDLLQGAVKSVEQRRQSDPQAGLGLRQELVQAELNLWRLQQQDPDDYDPTTNSSHEEGEPAAQKMLRADALKCLVLTRLPSVLCLHVQRRFYDPLTNRMCKTAQHVAFEELLDVSPYCAYGGGNANARSFFERQKQRRTTTRTPNLHTKPIWYRLTSVIVHQGNAFGGHYICYRRLPDLLQQQHPRATNSSHQWYYCSDDVVQPTTWDHVCRAQAYMLFYEAI